MVAGIAGHGRQGRRARQGKERNDRVSLSPAGALGSYPRLVNAYSLIAQAGRDDAALGRSGRIEPKRFG